MLHACSAKSSKCDGPDRDIRRSREIYVRDHSRKSGRALCSAALRVDLLVETTFQGMRLRIFLITKGCLLACLLLACFCCLLLLLACLFVCLLARLLRMMHERRNEARADNNINLILLPYYYFIRSILFTSFVHSFITTNNNNIYVNTPEGKIFQICPPGGKFSDNSSFLSYRV